MLESDGFVTVSVAVLEGSLRRSVSVTIANTTTGEEIFFHFIVSQRMFCKIPMPMAPLLIVTMCNRTVFSFL